MPSGWTRRCATGSLAQLAAGMATGIDGRRGIEAWTVEDAGWHARYWDSPRLATPRVPSRSDVSVFRVACYGGLCAAVASGVAVGPDLPRHERAAFFPLVSRISHVSVAHTRALTGVDRAFHPRRSIYLDALYLSAPRCRAHFSF